MNNILENIVRKNSYVINSNKNSIRNKHSMCYIISKSMTQSECIKFGIAMEGVIRDIILNYTSFLDIKEKNQKNKREKDHLFIDNKNKIIYYAEIKTNLNLDSEKTIATDKKCLEIYKELVEKYPNYIIKQNLVCLRYVNRIPDKIKNRFKSNVVGLNEYFRDLKIDIQFSDKNYESFVNFIADQMFK